MMKLGEGSANDLASVGTWIPRTSGGAVARCHDEPRADTAMTWRARPPSRWVVRTRPWGRLQTPPAGNSYPSSIIPPRRCGSSLSQSTDGSRDAGRCSRPREHLPGSCDVRRDAALTIGRRPYRPTICATGRHDQVSERCSLGRRRCNLGPRRRRARGSSYPRFLGTRASALAAPSFVSPPIQVRAGARTCRTLRASSSELEPERTTREVVPADDGAIGR